MDLPEIGFARRLFKKYKLRPPVDVRELLEKYARVTFVRFPLLDVDGVSIDIKGKCPHVIVNSSQPETRQRFTMAHELGHILIPWHIGTIIDQVDPSGDEENDYWNMEREANAFAAELLMPQDWLEEMLQRTNPAKVHVQLCIGGMSAHAAGIRLAELTEPHYVYCVEQDGAVVYSGRSEGTFANSPSCDEPLPAKAYCYAKHHFTAHHGDRRIHWWQLPDAVDIKRTDARSWREVLDAIAIDLGYRGDAATKVKNQINAVVAYANGATKKLPSYGVGTVVGAAVQRLRDRFKGEFQDFVEHGDFEIYLRKRAEELVSKPDQ